MGGFTDFRWFHCCTVSWMQISLRPWFPLFWFIFSELQCLFKDFSSQKSMWVACVLSHCLSEDAFSSLFSWVRTSLAFKSQVPTFHLKVQLMCYRCLLEFNVTETLETSFIFISLLIVWILCTRSILVFCCILVIKNSFQYMPGSESLHIDFYGIRKVPLSCLSLGFASFVFLKITFYCGKIHIT